MKLSCILITAIFCISLCAIAEADVTQRTATIVELEGEAQVITPENEKVPAEVGMSLTQGYAIKTGAESLVVVFLQGVSETANVEIKEKSELRLAELLEDKDIETQTTLLDLAIGEILITSKKLQAEKSKFEVKTPTSIVGVRGTTFSVSVEAE